MGLEFQAVKRPSAGITGRPVLSARSSAATTARSAVKASNYSLMQHVLTPAQRRNELGKANPGASHAEAAGSAQQVVAAANALGDAGTAGAEAAGRLRGLGASAVPDAGQPLPGPLRARLEAHLSADFSDVLVHDSPAAAGNALLLGAQAYSVGRHVVFGAGLHQPHTPAGLTLLAHELDHVASAAPHARSGTGAGTIVVPDGPARVSTTGEGLAIRRQMLTEDQALRQMAELQAVITDQHSSASRRAEARYQLAHVNALYRAGSFSKGTTIETAMGPALHSPYNAGDFALPPDATQEQVLAVMRVVDDMTPSTTASGLFTTTFRGKSITLTYAQARQVQEVARAAVRSALAQSRARTRRALGRYQVQKDINAEFPVTSRAAAAEAWISTLGNYGDPRASIYKQAADVALRASGAELAVSSGRFVRGMTLAIDADHTSQVTETLVASYVDKLIGSSESLVTGLTYTRTAASITAGIIGAVATGGTALGLEAAVVGPGLAGLTVAQTATVVAVGAPIAAGVGEGVLRTAHGDKVDWGKVSVDAAVQVIFSRFGGRLGQGIAAKIVRNPQVATLARQAVATLASGAATHVLYQAFTVSVDQTYRALRGETGSTTWGQFLDRLATALADPTGWFLAAASAATHLGVQVKVATTLNTQKAPPARAATHAAAPPADAMAVPKGLVSGQGAAFPVPAPEPVPTPQLVKQETSGWTRRMPGVAADNEAQDARFQAAKDAVTYATRPSAPTVSASSLGTIGKTQSKPYFRELTVKAVLSDPNHPLRPLLRGDKLPQSTAAGLNEREWLEDPGFLEAGHGNSAKGLGPSGGVHAKPGGLRLQSAYLNRLQSARVEHPSLGGLARDNIALVIGGDIPVHIQTAHDLVAAGYLDPQYVRTAALVRFDF